MAVGIQMEEENSSKKVYYKFIKEQLIDGIVLTFDFLNKNSLRSVFQDLKIDLLKPETLDNPQMAKKSPNNVGLLALIFIILHLVCYIFWYFTLEGQDQYNLGSWKSLTEPFRCAFISQNGHHKYIGHKHYDVNLGTYALTNSMPVLSLIPGIYVLRKTIYNKVNISFIMKYFWHYPLIKFFLLQVFKLLLTIVLYILFLIPQAYLYVELATPYTWKAQYIYVWEEGHVYFFLLAGLPNFLIIGLTFVLERIISFVIRKINKQ